MTRRTFLQTSTAALAGAALVPSDAFCESSGLQTSGEPVPLSEGVHLFIDDYLVASRAGLQRVVNSPVRLPYPIVTATDDHVYQPYVSVLRDPHTRRFRMWYNTAGSRIVSSHIGYLESDDGIHWIRPHLELPDPAPIAFGVSVIDRGAAFPDPSARYMLAWDRMGVMMAVSADGLGWTPVSRSPLIRKTGDVVSLSWDPYRRRYVVLCRLITDGLRIVGQSVSDDGLEWSPPRPILAPDALDGGRTEFYGIGNLVPAGGLLIGLLKVLRDDLPAEPGGSVNGIGYTVLAWTRDGEVWHRDRQPFMDRNPHPGTWDRAMTWGDCLLPVGDEAFIYYGGYARGHKVNRFTERHLGLARMPRDRYVARQAGPAGGWLRTPPVVLDGSALLVNADIAGELRVRVVDPDGRPIHGFDAADCSPLRGDALAHTVTWLGAFGSLAGRPVRLDFLLQDARLYGFELVGASGCSDCVRDPWERRFRRVWR